MCLSLSGVIIPALLKRFPGAGPAIVKILAFSPAFAAADAMTQTGMVALSGFGLELVWVAGLIAAVIAIERRPVERETVATTTMSFESPYDRAATALGFDHAPLVGWWLRFYGRNSRFKAMIVVSLPLVAFLTFNFGSKKGGVGLFAQALGMLPVATFLATSRFMVNQFGYLGGGYRRCFLLPVEPATVLRTGSYASMLLSVCFIPVGILAWIAFAPVPFDVRQVFMLIGSGLTGLFTFHALGLWATIYGARRGNYTQSMGNDLSLMGNIILIGGVMTCMFSPLLCRRFLPAMIDPAYWWLWLAPPTAAMIFYTQSLRITSGMLRGKREQLMAIVEGRA
jgi:hypothetical protein